MNEFMIFLGAMLVLSKAVEKLSSLLRFSNVLGKVQQGNETEQLPKLVWINFAISFLFIGLFVRIDAINILNTGKITRIDLQNLNMGVFLSVLIASMGSAFISDLLSLMKGLRK
jgi:hypothetical protein